MKRFIVLIVALAIITSAFLNSFDVPGEYLIKPRAYINRLQNCFDNSPEFDTISYSIAWETSKPNYDDNATIWENIKEAFSHWFSPLTNTCYNVYVFVKTMTSSIDWIKSTLLCFMPLDWQQMALDGVRVDIPWTGWLSDEILDKYFGVPDSDGGWRGGR